MTGFDPSRSLSEEEREETGRSMRLVAVAIVLSAVVVVVSFAAIIILAWQ